MVNRRLKFPPKIGTKIELIIRENVDNAGTTKERGGKQNLLFTEI